VCRMEAGALSFYSGARVPRRSGQVKEGGDATVAERVGRRQRGVGDVEAVMTSVMARTGVDGSRQATSCPCGVLAEDGDHGDGDWASASQ
jgi:hypothetical protein